MQDQNRAERAEERVRELEVALRALCVAVARQPSTDDYDVEAALVRARIALGAKR